jgi:hypothetical protein
VLEDIAKAFKGCYRPAKLGKGDRKTKAHVPSVADVILRLVADKYQVGARLVAGERAKLRKKNARPFAV